MIPRLSDDISVVARTKALRSAEVRLVVTVPTFKRPEWLLETLYSLKNQAPPVKFAVIVIENEAEQRQGAIAATPLVESGEIPGLVIIAHERGNCSAYNAGWQAAFVHFPEFTHILVIDDDEMAGDNWIAGMLLASARYRADIVGGPQVPVFEEPLHARWSAHPVFSPPYRSSGLVPALYSSGNLLVARHVLERLGTPFLEPMFNFTGGGDSDFLSRAAVAGFRLAWCAEAPVHEKVPARRVSPGWIRARSLRNGALSTIIEKRKRRNEPLGRLTVICRSLALLAVSPFRALGRLAGSGSPAVAGYPVYVALGRILAEFGYSNEQYRHPEKN